MHVGGQHLVEHGIPCPHNGSVGEGVDKEGHDPRGGEEGADGLHFQLQVIAQDVTHNVRHHALHEVHKHGVVCEEHGVRELKR